MRLKASSFIIVGLLCIYSCQQDLKKQNQELIIGEWYPLDIDTPPYAEFNFAGYEFKENGICENKIGYYEYANS